jgi:FAD/FMN-containing dehydrogenase/Fe-S oxidoreductase
VTRVALPTLADSAPAARAAIDVSPLQESLASTTSEVRFDRLSRALYSTDASVYQIVPQGVVLPRTEADIVAAVSACGRFGVPLTARGGGTSQAGQCIGPGVILDCSKHFAGILEINAAQRWARVEPGCVLDHLNRALAPLGLQFAPDISTANRATIGGMVANNSSGTRSVIHGKTIDHVLELRVVLADDSVIEARPLSAVELEAKCRQEDLEGHIYRTTRRLAEEHATEIERRFPRILRRVGGYNLDRFVPVGQDSAPVQIGQERNPVPRKSGAFNLADLFVGSEGTLGVVTQAKLRLVELPRAKAMLVVQFPGLLEALAATPAILSHGPSAVEVMDRYILASTRLNPEASRLRDFLHGDPAAILIIEFYLGEASVEPSGRRANAPLDALQAHLQQLGHGDYFHQATSAAEQQRIWKLRSLALGLSMAEKGDAKAISFVEDTAVSPDYLRDYIAEFLEIVARHGTSAGVYAHASVGCLHVRPVINLKTEQGLERFQAIADEVADLVLKYGGALSGEHGDGLVRSPFQEKMYGPTLYAAFRELKQAFDPQGIFNPGKIVDAPPLAANLRYGAAYVTPELPTTFDFSADGGLVRAAELCAGVGECRKERGGAMCPSYRATREEQHTTRARANALRLALTGQADLRGLSDPALAEVFDLCLECKACKSECPTNVDMARLKAEFLDQHFRAHGVPWRNRVFGHVARLSRWGSRLAPVSNWLMRSRWARWLNEELLGIDRRRLPPAFVRRTLVRTFEAIEQHGSEPFKHRALLFPDTFTNFYEPAIGAAAIGLLNRAGCTVTLGPPGLRCCGRPLISNGLLREAVLHARDNVTRLYPWAAEGVPILSCEPSCILTIQDDYPALLRDDLRRQAEVVAAACVTFEELLERLLGGGSSPFRGGPKRILLQGHCHQRSLVGMAATRRLLQRVPGAEVVDLDAGCCGMAGSFGYECEHYDVSRLVGEQQLFPAVRGADAETALVAPGFSCRMQIEHFCGRRAVHPAEFLVGLITGA